MRHLLFTEEMNNEAANLPQVFSSVHPRLIMGIAGVSYGVDVQSPRLEYPPNLL